jgi:hypothetical protein
MAFSLKLRLRLLKRQFRNWRGKLRQDKAARFRFFWKATFLLFALMGLFFIVGSLPLQQQFDAKLSMDNLSFIYTGSQDKIEVAGNINDISCLRLNGVRKWNLNAKIRTSSNPLLVGKKASEFQISDLNGLIFIGSCAGDSTKRTEQIKIQEIRIPAGTRIEDIHSPTEKSINIGFIPPHSKEILVKIFIGRSPLNVVLQGITDSHGEVSSVDLQYEDIEEQTLNLVLRSEESFHIASIRADFNSTASLSKTKFPELQVDQFLFEKCDIPENGQRRCRSLIQKGLFQFAGQEPAKLVNAPDELGISKDAKIEIEGGKVEFIKSIALTQDSVNVYLTGHSKSISIGSKSSKVVTLLDSIPDKISPVIIPAMVGFGFSLLIWIFQQWVE